MENLQETDRQHTLLEIMEHSNSDVSSDSESFHNSILQQAAANILQQGNSLNHSKELGKAMLKKISKRKQ